ncbi:hypothetical protein C2845_PM05G19050 [Panicum miliaceum]|uniref:Uncharacterized protein n=1 Tax=Panicum miliaceum TaxID=4540 RepID=A0A3L6SZP5_PANMI|nr:hypothetical protein C2845_PM05G19050 [Panicum miliaceum]
MVWQSAIPMLPQPSTRAMTAVRLKTALASPVSIVAAAILPVVARTPMPVVAAKIAVALLPPHTLNAGVPMKGAKNVKRAEIAPWATRVKDGESCVSDILPRVIIAPITGLAGPT